MIIDYKDVNQNNVSLLQKYSQQYLMSVLEREKLDQLEQQFKDYDKKGVDIIDFVRIFLNIIQHKENETLYLCIALVDFFRLISESLNMQQFLKYIDVTNFICDEFGDTALDQQILKTKYLPMQKVF